MLDYKLKGDLIGIFIKYREIDQVMLFGSRARGDYRSNSDVDLCIFGDNISHLILAKINMEINELNTPLSFDILAFNELSKPELIKNILSEGVVIYYGEKA